MKDGSILSNNIHKINSFIHDSDDKLNKIISGLQEISKLAEIQFSRISENLQYYYNTTKEISNESFSVAELFSDEDYSNKINRLKNISEKIFSSVSSNTDKFEGSGDSLNNII